MKNKALFWFLLDSLAILAGRDPVSSDKRQSLLLMRLDAIGDFVVWQDAAKGFRKLYPKESFRITLLGNTVWKDLAMSLPYFDEFLFLDQHRFEDDYRYRLHFLRLIRRSGFDLVVQPQFFRRFFVEDSIVRVSGASQRIGSQGDPKTRKPWQKKLSRKWYTKEIQEDSRPLMELERNAAFIRNLGWADFQADIPDLPATTELPISLNDVNYYVLFPGASWPGRQWPISNFARIAEKTHRQTEWIGVICGGNNDAVLGEQLEKLADAPFQNLIGHTSLTILNTIIAHARLLITNETSAIHFGAAAGVPSVCILGGGHYGRFLPYRIEQNTDKPLPRYTIHKMDCFGCDWECVFSVPNSQPVPCIEKIAVNDVWQSVSPFLK